jgi:uncharacterized protein YdeI (YjbR/CyaY-like superfamily)
MAKTSNSQAASRPKRFDAPLERLRPRNNWMIIRVPFDASAALGVRGQPAHGHIRVKGTINKIPFRSTLFPTRAGGYFLMVNRRMQKEAQVTIGEAARFELQRDTEERAATIPHQLKNVLAEDRSFRRWYDKLNYSTRYQIGRWINQPASGEARERRAQQIAERLFETMEAERELPPLLQLAFARNPQARAGWGRMSVARRRSHLLRIFYYRTPEGREKQIAKLLEDATAFAEKKGPTP